MAELESALALTISKIDMVMEKANKKQNNGKTPGTQEWGEDQV